jgi:hypothetical protein
MNIRQWRPKSDPVDMLDVHQNKRISVYTYFVPGLNLATVAPSEAHRQ